MKDFRLFIQNKILILLLAVFFLLITVNISLKNWIEKNTPKSAFFNFSAAPYAKLDVLGLLDVNISAESAVVMDEASKVVIFGKNENLRFSTASTAKIMTALTALDYYHPDDVLIIKTSNVEGVNVGFKIGETFKLEDLLYAMLLPSGNDAAFSIAQNYKDGEAGFIKKMNENAFKHHLFNTHFADPAGLLDNQDYTTVLDLARLSSVAMQNKTFAKIVATKQKIISNTEGTETYLLNNLNKLLDLKGINGVKTGFTSEAGGVLVTSKTRNGKNYIIVVMRSSDRFSDTEKLLSLVENITYTEINY